MKRYLPMLAIFLIPLVVFLLPACEPPEDLVPVDSTDYNRLIEVFTEIEGEAFAEEWARTHDPGSVVLVEDTVLLSGKTEIRINGELVAIDSNAVKEGLGQIMAYALRYGNCQIITAMQVKIKTDAWVNMSAPVRTAGGRGASPSVTVQSSLTNTGSYSVLFIAARLFAGIRQIAYQLGDQSLISPGDTLTINWTVAIGGTYSNTQRYQMAKGISPEAGYGGTIHNLFYGKFIHTGGFVSNPCKKWTGGDMNTMYLLGEWGYTHAGDPQTLTAFEVLNSNGDKAASKTGLAIELTEGKKINGFHLVTFLGTP